jgi:hypothetical protein
MLMFAAKCIGSSIDSVKTGQDDHFNDFGPTLFNDMKENIVYISKPDNINENNKTRILLDDLTYNSILNNSCIWLQILFSFLYWNEETDKSKRKIIENFVTVESDEIDVSAVTTASDENNKKSKKKSTKKDLIDDSDSEQTNNEIVSESQIIQPVFELDSEGFEF